MLALVTPGSTTSSRHCSLVKLVKATLVGFPFPDQLSCDNHSFFEGPHSLSSGTKTFNNSVVCSEGDVSEGCQII